MMIHTLLLSVIASSLLAQSPSQAPLPAQPQTPGQTPAQAQPAAQAPAQTPAPDALTVARQHLQEWRMKNQSLLADDWGQLGRYRAANAQINAQSNAQIKAPGETRVVFFGDSITEMWRLDQAFPGKPYLNRGIGGQTTSQMLVRFRQDVIQLQPRVVVILAGTNDIAGNTGPMAIEDIQANLASMAELARAHGIQAVLASVLPVHGDTPQAVDFFVTRPAEQILALNRWIKEYCARHRLVYLDYHGATVDERGCMKKELADDGLHPNAAGLRVMAPLAEAAIRKALF